MKNLGFVYHNLSVPKLIEHAVIRGEGELAANGALLVKTGKYTGRSPKDKFIVDEPGSRDDVCWNSLNVGISEEKFERLYQRVLDYVQGRDLYIFDGYVGADPKYQYSVRVVNEFAWQNLFVHQLFRRPANPEISNPNADFHVISVPGLQGDPELDGLHSEAFIVVHLTRQIVLIGGTHYGGEMKKSIFSLLNYVLAKRDVLPPISCLTREQAMYHFLSGYTSKLAGTERGITEPQSTFSACFGQCFFPLLPTVYAEMLGEKLKQHPESHVFLINTGGMAQIQDVSTVLSLS